MPEQPGQKYAFLHLAKALAAGSKDKARQWRDVLAAMQAGDLTVGSRTPVAGMPKWATPDIVRGGFATSTYAAGGDLQPHEIALAERLSLPTKDISQLRLALNNWHLSDDGLGILRDQAQSGRFTAQVPEETALLTVALLTDDDPNAAQAILTEITPFFDRLRFYPKPGENAGQDGVYVRTVRQIKKQLKDKRPAQQIILQHNSISLWIPLNDRLIDLLANGDKPDWHDQAETWLMEYDLASKKPMAQRWRKPNSPFQRCRQALIEKHKKMPLGQNLQADIDTIVARHVAKYGDAQTRAAHRKMQAEQDVTIWHDAVAKVLSKRLASLPADIGISDPESVTNAITSAEAITGAPAGHPLPKRFVHTVNTARMAPVADLVQTGQIGAPEVLAKVLPQITAKIHASGLQTNAETEVCTALYKAFRNRRSLLLLNLQSQVKLEELPWAAALLGRRDSSRNGKTIARDALTELARLSLTHFPHVIFPNTLIEEMDSLAKTADLDIPFTSEIAADIFMGSFAPRFAKAADISLAYYANTLYGRYYDLPTPEHGVSLSKLCARRTGRSRLNNWSVAANGMMLEQQQIITSHNLAQLFKTLDLSDLSFAQMATDCFDWICKRQQIPLHDWRAKLQMTKNTAYAWRQMIAFLSELEPDIQRTLVAQIKKTLAAQSSAFQNRIAPAIAGLDSALSGQVIHDTDQVFLGWVQGRHPFAP